MTIKEKLRAYDEIIEKAYKIHAENCGSCQACIEELIPEFKESREERVRKAIIDIIKSQKEQQCHVDSTIYDEMLDWLEKQGEEESIDPDTLIQQRVDALVDIVADQEPSNKIEPVFNVGDKIQYSKGCGTIMTIEKIENGEYIFGNNMGHITIEGGNRWYLVEQEPTDKVESKIKIEKGKWYVCNTTRYTDFIVGKVYYCPKNGMLKPNENEIARYVASDCFRLWTIQDSKNGDVLTDGEEIVIFKEYNYNQENGNGCVFVHCVLSNNGSEYWYEIGGINPGYLPATKEQRDTLMKAMADAGYTFDFEKKELKKIIDEKQKSTWSEEDETRLTNTIIMLKEGASLHFNKEDITKAVEWLKSLKDRYTWKPSVKQMNLLKELIEDNNQRYFYTILRSLYEQLKKLREE